MLQVIYLIFTEGSFASGGDDWIRTDLAGEARRLARVLVRLAPEPEVFGLLALLELTAARFPARLDASGQPVLLEDQDRRLWDQSAIRRGRAALARAVRGRARAGRLRTAGVHRRVPRGGAFRGRDGLAADRHPLRSPRPAGAVARSSSSIVRSRSRWRPVRRPGLALVDAIAARGELAGSHLLPAVRGELLTRLGRRDEARSALLQAVGLCGNAAERAALERKVDGLS